MVAKIRVVVADDHLLMREGYARILQEDPVIKVVGTAANGKELLNLLKSQETDVVLLDIEMPVMTGDEALTVIAKRYPEIKVIMVSMHHSDGVVNEFLRSGASSFLPKNVSSKILLEAIHKVVATGQYVHPHMANALYRNLKNERSGYFDHQFNLSEQELKVLKLICLGKKAKEIADVLKIATATVTFHRQNISEKTRIKSIPELVIFAIKRGILNIDDLH
jgi:DNA-binding NarL/FixJ family response regulator